MAQSMMGNLILLAALLIGTAMPARAQDVTVYNCDACTMSQMETLAKQKGLGTTYIYNLKNNIIVGFEKYREDSVPGVWTIVADTFIPEQWMVDQFIGVRDFYVANGNSLNTGLSASVASEGGDSVNAFDVTLSSVDRNRVADALAASPRIQAVAVLSSFGRVIRLAGIVTPDVPVTVKVNFPDGSSGIFKFNWDLKRWEYVKNTAIDSNGNSIPESESDFTNGGTSEGNFDFTRPGGNLRDVEDWIARATAAGVKLVGTGTRYACVKAGSLDTVCTSY